MRIRTAAWAALAGLLLGTILGCSNEPPMGDVEGMVTVDGKPAVMGAINFTPADGSLSPAGAEIKDGKYKLRVAVGNSKVEIRVPKKIGEKKLYNDPNSPVAPVFDETLPASANDASELKFDVKSGKNEKIWEMKSKGAK